MTTKINHMLAVSILCMLFLITKSFNDIPVCVNTMNSNYTEKWYDSGSRNVVDGIPFRILNL